MGFERHTACAVLPADDRVEYPQGQLAGLTTSLQRICASNFPVRQGYLTFSEPLADGQPGVRLRVIHDDFRGDVELHVEPSDLAQPGTAAAIRLRTSAGSQRLLRAERAAAKLASVSRPTGAVLGLLLVIAGAAALVGMSNLTLAAMFLLVMAAALPMAGWSLGAYVGERLAFGTHDRAVGRVCSDRSLQRDLLRWKAVSRLLLSRRRRAKMGRRLAPFRL